jgi:predicted ArsR family transcriptional regulator
VDEFVAQVNGVGSLAEPTRRALYLYVAAQPGPVSRDQAAEGVDLPRHAAKFHLDKLVEEGLLDTEYRRLSGRSGPGAGRPTKLYRRSSRSVSVTLPPRRYELAGAILAAAVEDADREGSPVLRAVERAAAAVGRSLGQAEGGRTPDGTSDALDTVAAALAAQGYEPRIEDDALLLANCPFHSLAREHTALVCGMNLHLITALLDELGHTDLRATLDPGPERCCVALTRHAPR